jgi:hypothetical protein
MATQSEQVLNHLQTKKTITSLEAINEYGITRLSSVIYFLKKDGHNIVATNTKVKNRFGKSCTVASYSLVK